MKIKLLLFLPVLMALVCSASAQADLNGDMMVIRANLDLSGVQDYYDQGYFVSTYNTDQGYGVGLEFYHSFLFRSTAGFGIRYELERALSGTNYKYRFVPVYFTAMFAPFYNPRDFLPYFKFETGFNVLFLGNNDFNTTASGTATTNGGLYFAFGVGIKFMDSIFIDLMSTSYSGTFSASNGVTYINETIRDYKVCLNLGFAFQIYSPEVNPGNNINDR